MGESTARKWLVGGLCFFAIGIFGVGINWGLSSHRIDPVLFGPGAAGELNSINANHLTGAGIDRLAGDFDESGNVAADVALHPIGDQSQPTTLVENLHGATTEELIREGDKKLARFVEAAEKADRELQRENISAAARAGALHISVVAHRGINGYLKAYNEKHFPGLADSLQRDAVSRARILRRYRLYSYQPDEMITFRALAMMHPGAMDFDPKLYQYGGLWIYPVGAILKAASFVGLVTVDGDRAYYLDSPGEFGKFYIVARAYSAAWGVIGMLAVFAIMRRASGGLILPAAAAVCFLCLPVVVDLGHEAKPHLAGTAILLLAVLAAGKYVETGRWKWIVWTAIACGAAAGMVLSSVVGLLILPFMSFCRRDNAKRFAAICFAGLVIPAAVYFATNPYVAIHLAGNRAVLESNFGNTSAMYARGPLGGSLCNAARLIAVGTSWPIAIIGVVAAISALCCKKSRGGLGWLVGPVGVVVFVQFVLYAWGKPGEYARFALFADVGLMLAAFLAIGRFIRGAAGRAVIGVLLVGCACTYSFAYERGFLRDSLADDSRTRAGQEINGRLKDPGELPNLYILNEPAPYCLPPVDLFGWHIVLLPRGEREPAEGDAGMLVRVIDRVEVFDPSATPISWADKSFEVVAVKGK